MKKFEKAAAASTAVILSAGLFLSGCGGADSQNGTKGSGSASGTESVGGGGNVWDGSLPLTEEKQTLTVWMRNDVGLMNVSGGDPNNTPFFQELEKRTNVHIEWQVPASGSEQEQFNLLFTSGELPDIMYNQGYIDGLDAAVEDGYILDLTPYVEENAPNFLAAVANAGPEAKKNVKTDAGRYAAITTIFQSEQPPWMGLMVRQDWLDELNLDVPVTVEEWEETLTAFKEKKGATAPITMGPGNILNLGMGLGLYGGDMFSSGWYQVDGKVGFNFYSDPEAGKNVLTMLNRWYGKGLIDPDFATADSFSADSVLVNNGSTGIFTSIYTYPSSMYAAAAAEGAKFTAIHPPVAKEGDPIKQRMGNQVNGAALLVSADCENPELAIRWIDYLFSEEGSMLANYGTEGETYTMVDGEPQYTELVTKNPDGLSFDDTLRYYTMAPGMPALLYDWERELGSVPPEAIAMMDEWGTSSYEYAYPAATMSSEENQEYSNIFTDLQTYVNESVLAFITGEKSLEEYDSFIATLGEYNIERCIELKQAALDRYNAR